MYPKKADLSIPMPPVTVIPQPEGGITVPNPYMQECDATTGWPISVIMTGKAEAQSIRPTGVRPLSGKVMTGPEVENGGNEASDMDDESKE